MPCDLNKCEKSHFQFIHCIEITKEIKAWAMEVMLNTTEILLREIHRTKKALFFS